MYYLVVWTMAFILFSYRNFHLCQGALSTWNCMTGHSAMVLVLLPWRIEITVQCMAFTLQMVPKIQLETSVLLEVLESVT